MTIYFTQTNHLEELVPQHMYVHPTRNIIMIDWNKISTKLHRDKTSCRNKHHTIVTKGKKDRSIEDAIISTLSTDIAFTKDDDELILNYVELFKNEKNKDDVWIVLSAELNRDIGSIKSRLNILHEL